MSLWGAYDHGSPPITTCPLEKGVKAFCCGQAKKDLEGISWIQGSQPTPQPPRGLPAERALTRTPLSQLTQRSPRVRKQATACRAR